MKISSDTISLLKNYATINEMLQSSGGSVLLSATPLNDIWARATVTENFPAFRFYNLKAFLATAAIFGPDAEFDFQQDFVEISKGNSRVMFNYADAAVMGRKVPDTLKFPESTISFEFTEKMINDLLKVAGTLSLDTFTILGTDEGITLVAYDEKTGDSTSNIYTVRVADNPTKREFELMSKIDRIMFLSGDYRIELVNEKAVRFIHSRKNVEYAIALSPKSKW
jgi:hypothetical protein